MVCYMNVKVVSGVWVVVVVLVCIGVDDDGNILIIGL